MYSSFATEQLFFLSKPLVLIKDENQGCQNTLLCNIHVVTIKVMTFLQGNPKKGFQGFIREWS